MKQLPAVRGTLASRVCTLPLVEINFGKEPVAVKAFVVWRIVDPVAFRKGAGGQDEEVERTIETSVRALMGQELPNHTKRSWAARKGSWRGE